MRLNRFPVALTAALCLASVAPAPALSQIGSLKKKAEEAAKKKAEEAAKKKAAAGDTTSAAPAAEAATAAPARNDPKVWENYDFVPGNKVLFYTDFSEDRVGNFARGLKYVGGPIEVVERDGVKMLRSTGRSTFLIPVGTVLPERFTLEIGVIAPTENCCGYEMLTFEGGREMDRGDQSADVNWHSNGTLIFGGGRDMSNSSVSFPEAFTAQLRGHVAHIRVLMDSAYFKMYTNERRVYSVPELWFKRDSVIRVFVNGSEEDNTAVFVTSIRVAESETDVLYDALLAKGRWVTQGILFATGKADLQPESRPVLKEIAATMTKYPDLTILIEGHTDNTGTSAGNLTLSDARAAAVKAALVADFGVPAERMTTRGLGDTQPAAPNTTATGRAQNRRVEIVKQ